MYSSSSSEGSEDNDESFCSISTAEVYEFHNIKENDPDTTMLSWSGDMNMTDEELEELGRDIANNTHLKNVHLIGGALDDHKISFFFRGLQRSASITTMHLYENGLSTAGLLSMVPFLQSADNLHRAKLEAIEAEIAAIEAADGDVTQVASESRSSKRRRT